MESKSFNSVDDEKLIECVRNYPVLYKLSDKNYKDNSVKENAWKEIAHFVGKNVNDCKTRWRTVRDSYKKNLKKRKLGTGSAAPTKSKYNDDALSFLNNIEDERRTKSNIAYNENLNYSEVMENESFNQTAESEENSFSNNSGQVSLETDNSIVDQPLENEIRDSLTDRFRKPYEKPKKIGTKDKIIEEIKKGREERLAALKEMRRGELCNDPIQIFFKSMASTVATFPPELAVEAKTRVFNIISELELRAIKAKASNTTSVEPIVPVSPIPSKQIVQTIFVEEGSSSSATSATSSVSCPTAAENSSFAFLQYYNNDNNDNNDY
ncbi:unnamed protein product [Macrosiphum euphorbiae]|nr:unnamed protein product [Macrosiphum euphorbiae]